MSKFSDDCKRFILCDQTNLVKALLFTQGVWAMANYRVAHAVYKEFNVPVLRQVTLFLMYLWRKLVEISTNIYLPWTAEIGRGLHITHCGYLVVHPQTRIGEFCTLSQGVTIGVKPVGSNPGVPVIGNRVYIAPNAILIGGIEIGEDAMVGAGAVVTKSVPARAVMAGNPARIISYRGSFDYIKYHGMENDSARLASLSLVDAEQDPDKESIH
jgi:serine O-acetyltransferase